MLFERVLKINFGCKKVFLKKTKTQKYIVRGKIPESWYESMTQSGKKTYVKLVEIIHGLEDIFGKGFAADRWVEKTKTENTFMTLEDILQKISGYKNIFLKKNKTNECLTKSGRIAYDKLVCLLYNLGHIFGEEFKADHWIDELDKIVDGEGNL